MSILVTGSSGHLGEALVRTLRRRGHEVIGLDITDSPFTDHVGSVTDRQLIRKCLRGTNSVVHAATLHKPHVKTHAQEDFVDTNVRGTLVLLEEAAASGVDAFVFTSTTSAFGEALVSPPNGPAVWVSESLTPVPKNIYGVTKVAAEDLCQLVHRQSGLPCIILRTSRFFPEEDDNDAIRKGYKDANAKINEFLYRRVDIEDVADAHLRAVEKASEFGFGKFIISATSPFGQDDLRELRENAPAVVERYFPDFPEIYSAFGWKMFPTIDRVYVNEQARLELGWKPRFNFGRLLENLRGGKEHFSALTRAVGTKGYHAQEFDQGPYPV